VVFGLHSEMILLWVGRHTLRQRPADEHPIVLKAKVEMQAARVVLLNDEAVAIALRGNACRHRLWRLASIAHAAVLLQPVSRLLRGVEAGLVLSRRFEGGQVAGGEARERIADLLHSLENSLIVELVE
jgi:hypothetical protein